MHRTGWPEAGGGTGVQAGGCRGKWQVGVCAAMDTLF